MEEGMFAIIQDEDGNEIELEHVKTIQFEDNEYMGFIHADTPEDADEVEIIVLRVDDEGDEEMLITIEDESELERVYTYLLTQLEEEDEDFDD